MIVKINIHKLTVLTKDPGLFDAHFVYLKSVLSSQTKAFPP